jgi:hypothetical protein
MDSSQLDAILEEISKFEIILVEDPTLAEFGNKYLHQCVAKCRAYMNRVQYYLQTCLAEEKKIRREISIAEASIDLKMAEKLADDAVVRKQPSIEDRKALATILLKEDYESLYILRTTAQDLDETVKIIRMKYNDLKATSSDIRLQRQLVRDDKENGGSTPGVNQDGSIPAGMPPPANKTRINPSDLLDPATRPADLPEPKDRAHAEQIADFFNAINVTKPEALPVVAIPIIEAPSVESALKYEDLL